jgi:hypothetical protein
MSAFADIKMDPREKVTDKSMNQNDRLGLKPQKDDLLVFTR